MSTILEKKKEKQSTLFDSGFIRKISAGQHEADKEKTMQAISKKHAEEVERKTQVLAEKKRKRKINEARVRVEENHKRQQLQNLNERGSILVFDEDGNHHNDARCGIQLNFEILDDAAIEEKIAAERDKKLLNAYILLR
jgi:hypothetical protein